MLSKRDKFKGKNGYFFDFLVRTGVAVGACVLAACVTSFVFIGGKVQKLGAGQTPGWVVAVWPYKTTALDGREYAHALHVRRPPPPLPRCLTPSTPAIAPRTRLLPIMFLTDKCRNLIVFLFSSLLPDRTWTSLCFRFSRGPRQRVCHGGTLAGFKLAVGLGGEGILMMVHAVFVRP